MYMTHSSIKTEQKVYIRNCDLPFSSSLNYRLSVKFPLMIEHACTQAHTQTHPPNTHTHTTKCPQITDGNSI